jgi:hypothetical protein
MDNLISGRQLAQAIGVSYQTVFNWTKAGRLPSYSCEDGRRRYDLADGVAAKAKTKPAAKREQGIPDPDPTIVGFCYSDPYGNIRVRFKDIMGKTHDAEVTPAAKAEDIALPAEDYYAKPPPKHPPGYAFIDMSERLNVVEPDANGRPKHTVSDMSPITESFDAPCQKINLDLTNNVTVEATATWAKTTPHNTIGVPNDIGPPPPVAFEFDDDGA